ncbi:MAG: hypothetical protein VX152_12415, partial [Pseudomonadota bacterium]|nr:hypothetical protein [Pseudomonadota bacterium]
MRKFFQETVMTAQMQFHGARVMLLGDTGAGKSALQRALRLGLLALLALGVILAPWARGLDADEDPGRERLRTEQTKILEKVGQLGEAMQALEEEMARTGFEYEAKLLRAAREHIR